jgi:hypothetical protein
VSLFGVKAKEGIELRNGAKDRFIVTLQKPVFDP